MHECVRICKEMLGWRTVERVEELKSSKKY